MDLLKMYHDEDSVADTSSDHLSTDSPDTNDVYEETPIAPRIGDEYQVELPLVGRKLQYHGAVGNSVCDVTLIDIDCSIGIGLDIPVAWVPDWHEQELSGATTRNTDVTGTTPVILNDAQIIDSQTSSEGGYGNANENTCGTCPRALSYTDEQLEQVTDYREYIPMPSIHFTPWSEDEKKVFILGLYIFGKDLVQVGRFMESKRMGDILSFYYGSFYRCDAHRRWSECRKMRSRKCIFGQRIFSGWRQNELLQRLDTNLSEANRTCLFEATKALSEGRASLEEYVSILKTAVGLKVLVEAIGIGKHYDLTGMVSDPSRTNQVLSIRAEIPVGKACSSLTTGDIIKFLTGDFRLSKARSNDLFWEAVWPRLLAKGWHSTQPKNSGFVASRHGLVFLVPAIKKFSSKLVKGKHYFDSVSDVLNKVVSDPRLLELDNDPPKGGSSTKVEHQHDGSIKIEENGASNQQQNFYLRPRLPVCNAELMKFTIVDTSLVQGEPPYRVREQRNLPMDNSFNYCPSSPSEAEESETSEDQPSSTEISLTDQESDPNLPDGKKFLNNKSSVKVIRSIASDQVASSSKRRIPTNIQNSDGQCPPKAGNVDLVKGSKFRSSHGVKCGKRNYLSPVNKRQRLTVSNDVVSGDLAKDDCLSMDIKNEIVVMGSGTSVGKLCNHLSPKDSDERSEYIPSHNCSCASNVEKVKAPIEKPRVRDLIDLNVPQFPVDLDACEAFSAEVVDNQDDLSLKPSTFPSDRGHNLAKLQSAESLNGVSNDQNLMVSTRRQSTRNRPLTTRALEALASGFLTTRRKGTVGKTSNNVASRSKKHLCKTVKTSVSLADHDNVISDSVDTRFEPVDEECSSNANLP